MNTAQIITPVIALAGWTILIWGWMLVTRLPALRAARVKLGKLRGGTGRNAEGVVPDAVQWKAHNYNHLHEAPTVFYAVALGLAVMGHGDGLNAALAWLYFALRVVHSLIQTLWNKVIWRLAVYVASQLVIAALVISAGCALLK
ncbi:MAPEG family protein [Novosphingobium sp.]|uniref:MAPEG family protein n=1 Tax=Novosphingobium sp. TaxID=1874826 RepID=UPI00286C18C3|nr:MAPEG family protein [Novosphingobium sp.]